MTQALGYAAQSATAPLTPFKFEPDLQADFCAEHGIVAEVEVIPMAKIDESFERMVKGDVKYRFVIDMATLSS